MAPPKSKEEAISRAEARQKKNGTPSEDMQLTIGRFAKDHKLGDEVELGLRLVAEEQVRRLLGIADFRRRVREAADPHEVVLREVLLLDPEVEGIIRVLLSPNNKDQKDGKDDGKKGHRDRRHSSRTETKRSRSRRRRRDDDEHKSSKHGHSEHKSSGHHSSSHKHRHSGSHADKSSRHGHGSDRHRRDKDHKSEPTGAARGGVWDAPSGVWDAPAEEIPPSVGAPLAAKAASKAVPKAAPKAAPRAPVPSAAPSASSTKAMEDWIMSLDGGRGGMVKYLEPLKREFGGDLGALAATVLTKPTSGSVVGWIDASLWGALGVEALGHKLTLAKGIVALSKGEGAV